MSSCQRVSSNLSRSLTSTPRTAPSHLSLLTKWIQTGKPFVSLPSPPHHGVETFKPTPASHDSRFGHITLSCSNINQ
eukprot:scaffold2393_cov116-Alexandrium_tamarense.AAC.3